MLRRPGAVLVLAFVCLVGLAACNGSSSPTPHTAPSSTVGGSGHLPTSAHEFSGTLSVSGATTQTATFTETLENLPACSVLAKTGADGTWSIPQPDSNTFSLNWNISPYSGPGTFTNPSDFQDSVELDAAGQEFDPVASSTLLITVNADGSGSAKFSNLQNQYTQAAVNGTETWTCS